VPLSIDRIQWVELRTATEIRQLPADRPQLFRWWADYLIHPCEVTPCTGTCGIWHPTTDAANALLLVAFGLHD